MITGKEVAFGSMAALGMWCLIFGTFRVRDWRREKRR